MNAVARITAALRARTYVRPQNPPSTSPPRSIPASLLRSPLGAANQAPLELLLEELHTRRDQHFWIALVPGSSEQWGHHRAPPREHEARGVRISLEFQRRIARALELLRRGVVRFVLLSGGSVDPARQDYNEALRGRDHVLAAWKAHAPGDDPHSLGDLTRRVLVDPLAHTSITNVRNADKLCLDLGLDRLLIATSMPPNGKIWPANFPVVHQTNQGWYYLHHGLSTFDLRCRRSIGYSLGAFDWFETPPDVTGTRVTAIAHHGFDPERIAQDDYGP